MTKGISGADNIRVQWKDHVATVMIATGAERLASPLRGELIAVLQDLNTDSSPCRAIVLAAEDGVFRAGNDELEGHEHSPALELFKLIAAGKRPVVAAVEKGAEGWGLSIVAACDFVVATPAATFSCSFGQAGMLPQGGIYWSLARRIGAARTRQALLTGQMFDGEKARNLGLANELTTPDAVLEQAERIASRYAAMPPLAMGSLKAVMANSSDTLDQAIETEMNVQPLLRFTEDHKEAVQAFLEKRAPRFVGR